MLKKLFLIAIALVLTVGANTINANSVSISSIEEEESLIDVWGLDELVDWTILNPALEEHYWKSVQFYSDDKYKTVNNRLEAMLNIALRDYDAAEIGSDEATYLEILIYYVEVYALPSVQ